MIIPGFEFRNRGLVRLVVSTQLEQAGFKNAFSTRSGGVSPLPDHALSLGNVSQDQQANVTENRRRFLDALDATDRTLVTARQVHSADVRLVRDLEDASGPAVTCDALVARTSDAMLAVQTADCLPILLADTQTGAFAAVHAGWRGTLQGIVARTVELMQQTYGTVSTDILAALGPAIGSCCFEVGPEVVELFREKFSDAEQCFSQGQPDGKAHLDLNKLNRQQLVDCGVQNDRISDAGLCTVCRNDLFFSYRKERGAERPVGRLMGVIGRMD
ncbi:MAG: peptidoglycan editing factor PgeF [Acidobacteriota bacterium]